MSEEDAPHRDAGRALLVELERWLWEGTVVPRASIEAVAASTEELSDLYTIERGLLSRRQGDRDHLEAKVLSFLASDAPKCALVLEEASRRDEAFVGVERIVDLGCGVGATSVGYLMWLARRRAQFGSGAIPKCITVLGVDHAPAGLAAWSAVVTRAASILGIEATLSMRVADCFAADASTVVPPSSDLILCQAALNERLPGNRSGELTHDAATIDRVAAWAETAPTILIEPALRATTRPLQRLRDALLARGGIRVVAPCPHERNCPMLANERDWCHESRRTDPTPMTAAISALTRRRDERAIFSFLATAPGARPAPPSASVWRLVSEALGSRGKTERWVCCGDGRLRCVRVLDRERSAANSTLIDAERGTLVALEVLPESDRIGPDLAVRAIDEANRGT